ncbi:hypothetical protein C8J56DRAFT_1060654 [Mycena floridula]|nr:hypothetical protein C8J56DRAFT_1060654 [Mycena floridula]
MNRANSRASSRSPRPFLPPSHYAAAGGFTIPSTPKSPEPRNEQARNSFMPISYNSNSSFEFPAPDSASRPKRQSQIGNLPLVETQLLPSLRDTIDRMTRPPSRNHLEKPKNIRSERSLSPRPCPTSPNPSKIEPSTPKAKQVPLKPPLKSALRTPTLNSKISSPKPEYILETPPPLSSNSYGGAALKSVRSLLRRKSSASSATAPEPISKRQASKESEESPVFQPRSRSRTDPGTSVPPTPPVRLASTPQPNSYSSNQPKQSFVSNIPRRAATAGRSFSSTEDSDLEYRYELQGRDRRKLVVANAEVFASSSSSSEGEAIQSPDGMHTERSQSQNWRTNVRTAGLGLSLSPRQAQIYGSPYEDQRNQLEEAQFFDNPHQYDSEEDLDAAHRKRRAALMGLVSGLEKMSSGHAINQSWGEESDYHGVEGLAISGSQEVCNDDTASDSGSEYDNGDHPALPPIPEPEPVHSRSYHHHRQAPPPSPSSFSSNFANLRPVEKLPPTRPSRPKPLLEIDTSRKSPADQPPSRRVFEHHNYDSVSIVQHSRAAAARERQALGIPPSQSDDMGNSDSTLPPADSVLSMVGNECVYQGDVELSVGAQSLFRSLTDRRGSDASRRASPSEPEARRAISPNPPAERQRSRTPGYRDEGFAEKQPGLPDGSWAAGLSHDDYTALAGRHGTLEIQRQETIWELCRSEAAFVGRVSSIVNNFILPLRVQDSKKWISGVPVDIANLLDWLEDIINLHTQILAKLEGIHTTQNLFVERVAGELRALVPRLEIYQPYLVSVDHAVSLVSQMSQDRTSDFGEFVRIQGSGGDRILEKLLMEPAKRLTDYRTLFRQLLDTTPKTHDDFFATLSLFRSTDMVVKVMLEVKSREEEYDMVKEIADRMVGLPASFQLATRERRLLYRGRLDVVDMEAEPDLPSQSRFKSRLPKRNQSTPPFNPEAPSLPKSTRLVDAINEWDTRRGRSGSVKSTASSSTGVSFRSYDTSSSSDSSTFPPTPSPAGAGFPSSFHIASPDSLTDPNPYPPALKFRPRLTQQSPLSRKTVSSNLLQVFVFTDMVVMATPKTDKDGTVYWKLSEGVGVSQVVDVTEISDDVNDMPLIALDLRPLNVQDTGLKLLYVALPRSEDSSSQRRDEETATWVSAFRRSLQFTLRTISNPTDSQCSTDFFDLELLQDTQATMHSILTSGLPMPKSPSLQIQETQENDKPDNRRREREARGWWSLRFQQVLREMQRQEVLFVSANCSPL